MNPGTKNMWVTRCEHIGALVGGLLSLIFGWVPKLYREMKENTAITFLLLVFICCASIFWHAMADIISRNKPASIESIKVFMQKEDTECRTRLITDKIKHMTASITNADLTGFSLYCKQQLEVKNQKELLQELNK